MAVDGGFARVGDASAGHNVSLGIQDYFEEEGRNRLEGW
jgi:hypothetical protein